MESRLGPGEIKMGETIWGNTTRSRSGRTAQVIQPFSSGSVFGIRYSSSVRWCSADENSSSSSCGEGQSSPFIDHFLSTDNEWTGAWLDPSASRPNALLLQ